MDLELNDTRSALDRVGQSKFAKRRALYKSILFWSVIIIVAFALSHLYQIKMKSYEVDRKAMMAEAYKTNNIPVKHYKIISEN